MEKTYRPRNFRIITHTTQKRILHVEDALAIGQIHFELWDFVRGQGSRGKVEAYVGVDDARLLCADLAAGRLPGRFQSLGGSRRDQAVIARVITVEETDTNNPIKISIQNGPGFLQPNGLITPAWWSKNSETRPDELAILLSWPVARKIGLAVKDHITAWMVASYYQRIASGTWRSPGTVLHQMNGGINE